MHTTGLLGRKFHTPLIDASYIRSQGRASLANKIAECVDFPDSVGFPFRFGQGSGSERLAH